MTDLSVEQIIANKDIFPTIVNDKSTFVVVTYWWGKGRLNKNTSRPCLEFYEKLLMRPFIMLGSYADNLTIIPDTFDLFDFLYRTKAFQKFYDREAQSYTRLSKSVSAAISTKEFIISIVKNAFNANRELALKFQNTTYQRLELGRTYRKHKPNISDEAMKEDINKLIMLRDTIKNEIKASLRNSKDPSLNFLSQLEEALMYQPPLMFEKMIERWENDCRKANCNFMAVEYPEFTLPGGYQKAINAKPLFIQKALYSCGGRGVVYIDGDMVITQYPHIFDMPDIDFMARGWNIDPRSNYLYRPPEPGEGHWTPSITVDPYVFETSGGIMFFSDSCESKALLNLWVEETAKPGNKGKADDRILSLIFNTKHLLAPMKILQLPIEYLWLSMDYDYSVGRDDYDPSEIYVTHPECLTSEDTAGAQGASSSRQPKYYEALDIIADRSEMLYESVMFTSRLMARQLGSWLNYIGNAVYYSGDEEGDSPFYVIPWGSFGKKDAVVFANNTAVEKTPDISSNIDKESGIITLNQETFTIHTILKQLTLGRDILYIPTTATPGYLAAVRNILKVDQNARLELMFADTQRRVKPDQFFLFTIDLTQPIYIRHSNPLIYIMCSLCKDLNEFSNIFHANYQFLSQIRINVLKSVKDPFRGGGNNNNMNEGDDTHNTMDAYEAIYKSAPCEKKIPDSKNMLVRSAKNAKDAVKREEYKTGQLRMNKPSSEVVGPLTFTRTQISVPTSLALNKPVERAPSPTLYPNEVEMRNATRSNSKNTKKNRRTQKTRKN